jgi:hypothetical protein
MYAMPPRTADIALWSIVSAACKSVILRVFMLVSTE